MNAIAFGAPALLWGLAIPGTLLLLWVWRFARRRVALGGWSRRRTVPVRERFRSGGELTFWLCQIGALALMTLALSRPLAPSALPQRTGLDIVVLQDASASMRIGDVARVTSDSGAGIAASRDRWQRS